MEYWVISQLLSFKIIILIYSCSLRNDAVDETEWHRRERDQTRGVEHRGVRGAVGPVSRFDSWLDIRRLGTSDSGVRLSKSSMAWLLVIWAEIDLKVAQNDAVE